MDLTALINHMLNFAAPAGVLALLLPFGSRFFIKKRHQGLIWWVEVAIVFVACLAVLLAGLACFGRDGKMATYGGLVLVAATVQWLMLRGWR